MGQVEWTTNGTHVLFTFSILVYLLLGLVFMTLTATVFYDIPQLNLGTVLQQQKDLHLKRALSKTMEDQQTDEQADEPDEKTNLKKSLKKIITISKNKINPTK